MKTTIHIPDELFRRAKGAVSMRGGTLKDFFIRAAERELRRMEAGEDSDTAVCRWHRLLCTPSEADQEELDRIDARISEAFSTVDPDDWT